MSCLIHQSSYRQYTRLFDVCMFVRLFVPCLSSDSELIIPVTRYDKLQSRIHFDNMQHCMPGIIIIMRLTAV